VNSDRIKRIALTFDDGPSDSDSTDNILTVLDKYGVAATFCVVGRMVESHPEKVIMEYRAGHLIENHSRTHPEFSKLTYDQMAGEIDSVTAQIELLGIPAPKYFRPPCGDHDGATLTNILNYRGLTPLYWSIDPLDWAINDVETVHRNAVAALRASWNFSRTTNILLFHDTLPHTPRVIDMLIPELQAEGCRFVPVDAII
jgi:peptidoglycan-N-acetylglucosamine deacetylase